MLLSGDAQLDTGTDSAVDKEAFLAKVPDIIPACVAGIHEFWKNSGPIASHCQGGIEAAAEVAGAIDTTAHTDRQHGRRSQSGRGRGGVG